MSDHWEQVYATRDVAQRSWSEDEPTTSLSLLEVLGVTPDTSLIDVGAGESELVDHLLARGLRDLTVLDLAANALAATRARSGREVVTMVPADVTTWVSSRRFDVWHDRAVLHFLAPDLAALYARTLRRVLAPDGAVVIGVFALDGPESCSGLPVTRYGPEELTALLGDDFSVVDQRHEIHRTPWGSEQAFQWVAARRHGARAPRSSAPGTAS